MGTLSLLVLIFILIGGYFLIKYLLKRRDEYYSNKIQLKLLSMGAKLLNTQYCMFENGPFETCSRGEFIYCFEYEINNEFRIGYVKFGQFRTEWDLWS